SFLSGSSKHKQARAQQEAAARDTFGSSDSDGDASFDSRRAPRRSGSTRALSRERYTVQPAGNGDGPIVAPPHARSASVPSVSDMIKKAEKKIEAQTAHHVRQVSSGSTRWRRPGSR
ncbi:unnamed protein product, partial [Laminaria digitata]